jgi:N-acetylglucosaminyl-diphospho-decaprenol L-rhamnosyltransferase
MSLSLVIVNYNTVEDLRKCLITLKERLGSWETIVVDNGSSDGSREMVLKEFPWVDLVDNPGNPGYASACNKGLAETSQPYVLILNSDVEFLENGLEEVLDYLDANPDVGALGPMVLNSDGSAQMSCRRFPSMRENMVHGFLGDFWPDNPLTRSYQMKDMRREEICEADWVSGAAMFLRRSAAEKVGGFDENYFMYVEDVDLCWRLKRAGFKVTYHPSFKLIHHIGRTSSQQSMRMLYEHHRSMYIFFRRRYTGWRKFVLLPLVLAGLAGRFLLSLLIQHVRARRERVSRA